MKQIFRNLIVIIAMVLITIPSFGWGRRVHAAIAYIAEQNLTPSAKKTVDEILEGKTMSYYASWLDYYRAEMQITYTEDGVTYPRNIPHSFKVDKDCKVFAQDHQEALDIIGECMDLLKDWKNADPKMRLGAMQCIIHLVGDIHCPGHVKFADGRAGDGLGQGKYDVTFFGKKTTMHTVWDSQIVDFLSYGGVVDLAAMVGTVSKKEMKEIQAGGLYDWGQDIADRAKTVWPVEPGSDVNKQYCHQVSDTTFDLIRRAGLRLAKIMNDLF